MLERMTTLPPGIDGVNATGMISKEDYEAVMDPIMDAARREDSTSGALSGGPRVSQLDTPGAAWEDMKVGLRSIRLFDACAVATDIAWIREATRLTTFLMPCPVKLFAADEVDGAVDWLRTIQDRAAVSHRLLADRGVLVVEVKQSLRAQDFDAVAATADMWIEAHGSLQGLVIHVRAFPGWENIGAFMRHLRFLRDHQRKIQRSRLGGGRHAGQSRPAHRGTFYPRGAQGVCVRGPRRRHHLGQRPGCVARVDPLSDAPVHRHAQDPWPCRDKNSHEVE